MTERDRLLELERDLLKLFQGILSISTMKADKEKFDEIVKEGMREKTT